MSSFRTQSEGIIKSFHFGKWDGQPKTPAATTAPPLTPPGRMIERPDAATINYRFGDPC